MMGVITEPIRSKLRKHPASRQSAEDACQETMLRLLTYFHAGKTLRTPASLPGFVEAVCTNVVLEMIRANTRDRQLSESMPHPVHLGPDPERAAIVQERYRTIQFILGRMHEK